MTLFGRLWDLVVTVILLFLMALGYALWLVLFPFYRGKTVFRVMLIFILALALLAGGALFLFLKKVSLPRQGAPQVESVVMIEKGATVRNIGDQLKRSRIIDSPLQFRVLCILKGETRKLKAGRYKFTNEMSVNDILLALSRGRVYDNTVLIPEGLPSWEIASILFRAIGLDSAAFLHRVNDSAFAESLGVSAPSMEGYLFPDTYTFRWDAGLDDVLREMVGRFNQEFAGVFVKNATTERYSRHQIVIMASIVEGEAAVNREGPMISGVFYNRLNKNMRLGADPTICYAVHKFGKPLTKSDLQVNSPYNTRLYPGLPPGPILNPGRASLAAAVSPAETRMLYFVAKDDGSRRHYFTATHQEHLRMKQRARETREKPDAP
jgi:UPF0755 protein